MLAVDKKPTLFAGVCYIFCVSHNQEIFRFRETQKQNLAVGHHSTSYFE